MSTSSFLLSPKKDRRASKHERRGVWSRGSKKRDERVKYHKVDKVKLIQRTRSGREPRQKKNLKKEDLCSYDRVELVDIMSSATIADDDSRVPNENGEYSRGRNQISDATDDTTVLESIEENVNGVETSSHSELKLIGKEENVFKIANPATIQESSKESYGASETSPMGIKLSSPNGNENPISETSSLGIKHLYQSSNVLEQSQIQIKDETNSDMIQDMADKRKADTPIGLIADETFPSQVSQMQRYNQLVEDLKEKIRVLVEFEFPHRIESITQLLAREKQKLLRSSLLGNSSGSFLSLHNLPNTECMERQVLTVNSDHVELIGIVNSHVQSLVQDIGVLKLWMYKDLVMDSKDADTMNELLQEIVIAENESRSIQDEILSNYAKRNSVVSEIFKYPQLQNEHLLEALNYKQIVDLHIMLTVLKNKYKILHSLVKSLLNTKENEPPSVAQ